MRQYVFVLVHTLHDQWEEQEQIAEREKHRAMLDYLILHQPDTARDLFLGKAPDTIPPPDDQPMSETEFLLGDPYLHISPPGMTPSGQNGTRTTS